MTGGLNSLRGATGQLTSAALMALFLAQLLIAALTTPPAAPAPGQTLVICGPSGTYTVTLSPDGEPTRSPPHCPYCIAGLAVAEPPAPALTEPRLVLAARLVIAVESRSPPRPPRLSPPSRAPPRLA